MAESAKTTKIQWHVHLLWIIGVLLVAISVLLWRLPDGASLSGYIAFAASIASLILATVAIFQSIISSHSLNSSLFAISSSAQEIMSETARLRSISVTLGEDAEKSLSRLGTIPGNLDSFRQEVSEQFGKLSTPLPSNLRSAETDGDKFWTSGSNLAGLAYYVLALGDYTGRPFDIDDLISSEGSELPKYYLQGTIETFQKFKLCGASINGVRGTYRVEHFGGKALEIIEYFENLNITSSFVKEVFTEVASKFGREKSWISPSEDGTAAHTNGAQTTEP